MKLLSVSLIIFFATLLAAAVVAFGDPARKEPPLARNTRAAGVQQAPGSTGSSALQPVVSSDASASLRARR